MAYISTQVVKLLPDGNLSPSRITLGNQGDMGVSQLQFDVSALDYAALYTDYEMGLLFFNPSLPRSLTNPLYYTIPYENSSYTFNLPDGFTETMVGKYYLFTIILVERTPSAHHTTDREIWQSKEGYAFVNRTVWNSQVSSALAEATTITDTGSIDLSKPPIMVSSSSDLCQINCLDIELGGRMDTAVRRIQFQDNISSAELPYKWGVFYNKKVLKVYKFTDDQHLIPNSILIPNEIMDQQNPLTFSVIMATGEDPTESGYQRRVSTPLIYYIYRGFVQSGDILDLNNFVTHDYEYVYTTDDTIFNVLE